LSFRRQCDCVGGICFQIVKSRSLAGARDDKQRLRVALCHSEDNAFLSEESAFSLFKSRSLAGARDDKHTLTERRAALGHSDDNAILSEESAFKSLKAGPSLALGMTNRDYAPHLVIPTTMQFCRRNLLSNR